MNERAIFVDALDKTGAERVAYLDAACGGDADLRQRIERLLAANEAAGGMLDRLAVAGTDQTGAYEPSPTAGTVVAGRYKLLELIGEGGMATVYRGTQDAEPTEIAIKIIRHRSPQAFSTRPRR